MKNFILILFLSVISMSGFAQFGKAVQMPVVAGDTIVNTGSCSKIITATAGYNAIAIQPVFTKGTGTIGGTSILYGSLDGVNYVATGDTLTMTNQTTNTAIFVHATTPYCFYKLVTTGTGTMNGRLKVWYTLRKTITQ